MRPFVLGLLAVACGATPAASPELAPSDKTSAPSGKTTPKESVVPDGSREPKLGVRGSRHRLELGRYAIEVDADDGGRIVEYSLDGKNAFASRDDSPVAYGTSFWPSPQSDWSWPPPPELDRLPWKARSEGATIHLESAVNAALGLAAVLHVWMERETGSVGMEYVLQNLGSTARRVAPWQNTRVRPGGLTFYPSRGPALPGSTLVPELIDGVAWLLHDPKTMTENAKSFADGAEGFLAHVEQGVLFVKVWDDVPREKQAPGEAEIELYVDKTGRFVEIEQQGAYEELGPRAALEWTVHFLLERLDPGIAVRPGSVALVEAARSLARRVKSKTADPG